MIRTAHVGLLLAMVAVAAPSAFGQSSGHTASGPPKAWSEGVHGTGSASRFSCSPIPVPVVDESQLAEAIAFANDDRICPGPDIIELGGGTITLTTTLPTITASLTIQNGAIRRDELAPALGLLAFDDPDGVLTLDDLVLAGGDASTGAALNARSGLLYLDRVTVRDNRSVNGAVAVSGRDTGLGISNSTFVGNSATERGGALYLGSAGDVHIFNTTVSGNHAGFRGGAIYAGNAIALTLINVAIRGNSASVEGGGLFSVGTSDLFNVLISGNQAGESAGGALLGPGTRPDLLNVTIAGNRSADSSGVGGVWIVDFAEVDMINTLVWGNRSGSAGGTTAANVLLGESSATLRAAHSVVEGGLPAGSDDLGGNRSADPRFVVPITPEAANMPSADGDYRLLQSSPALDAGDAAASLSGISVSDLAVDLAGDPRIRNDIVDIGAYEGGVSTAAPDAVASPDRLDFGEVAPGGASDIDTLIVDNLGDAPLAIDTVTIVGPTADDFLILPGTDQCSGQNVAPGNTCGLGIRFVPLGLGMRKARARIPSDDPDGPVEVALQGSSGVLFFDDFE